MKYLLIVLVAACAVAPVYSADAKPAAEAAEAAEPTPPSPEEIAKMRKKVLAANKPTKKVEAAKKLSEAGQWPVLVCILPKMIPRGNAMEDFKKVLMHKGFKEFQNQNFVMLNLEIDKDVKNPKKITLQGKKPPELKILENFVVDEAMIKKAKQYDKPEPVYTDMACYPAIFLLNPGMQRQLFRFTFDKEGGLGVLLSQMNDLLSTAGIEPVLTPLVKKIVENPDEPKKWK